MKLFEEFNGEITCEEAYQLYYLLFERHLYRAILDNLLSEVCIARPDLCSSK